MFDEAELRRCAEADDFREALRLCQAHRDRLLADNTKLQVKLRVLRGELEQERAARLNLIHSSPGPAVTTVAPASATNSSSGHGSGSTPCYPQTGRESHLKPPRETHNDTR